MTPRAPTLTPSLALLLVAAGCGGPAPAPTRPASDPAAPAPVRRDDGVALPVAPVPGEISNRGGDELALGGTYLAPHEVLVVCDRPDGWCPQPVTDRLVATDAGDGALAVQIEVYAANAHTCYFEGTLAADPTPAGAERRWVHHGSTAEGDEPCTLTLTADPARRLLFLAADGCRQWCGVRASLDATFPLDPSR